MCGINGFKGRDEVRLVAMNGAISHRGPDYAGTYVDDAVSLGHVLLSIRSNPEVSGQPYREVESPWILLFNGQLYNTAQLKAQLSKDFADEDLDTRLLYKVIQKMGWGFPSRVHGMYAIALYNAQEGVVRLYRDPSGQKPLYYYTKGSAFVFSSEIKGILAHPGIDREPDLEAVEIAASLGYIPGDKTLFRHIRKVNLSEEVTYDTRTGSLSRRMFRAECDGYYEGVNGRIFGDLVGEHLQSKRKVSINLSGGLDSSLILHEMSNRGFVVDTYTSLFDVGDPSYNEDARLAKRLSSDYGTNHHEIVITKRAFMDAFVEAYRTIEEPNYNNSIPHLLLMFKAEGARGDGNRVMLSGDGGDEVFAGYPHHLESVRYDRLQRLMTPYLLNYIASRKAGEHYRLDSIPERWYYMKRFRNPAIRASQIDVKVYIRNLSDPYLAEYASKGCSIHRTMVMDRLVWLGSENFIRSDKLGMSQSLELRSPLSYMPFRREMDRRIGRGQYINARANKLYLRRAFEGKLPAYIVQRTQKTGWRSPLKTWYDREFKGMYLEILGQVARKDSFVRWDALIRQVESSEKWPAKALNLYLSLAILAKEFSLDI